MKQRFVKSLRLVAVVALTFLILSGCTVPDNTFISTVDGESMEPTIHHGSQVVILRTRTFKHNDIACYKAYGVGGSYEDDIGKYDYVIKRVIAMDGDIIEFVRIGISAYFSIYLNGVALDEYYLDSYLGQTLPHTYVENSFIKTSPDRFEHTMEKGTMFCIGDNRLYSYDCRYYGPVNISQGIGKVIEIKSHE